MKIEALNPVTGAVVSGLAVTEPLADVARDALLDALLRHHVLFFENQPLTPRRRRDLAARFAEWHVHPIYPHVDEVPEIIVLDTSTNKLPDHDNWHTDVTFIQTPPTGALRSALQFQRNTQIRSTAGSSPDWARSVKRRAMR